MTEISLEALARRIEELENKVVDREFREKDRRNVVGVFDDDPEFMQQVFARVAANCEAERPGLLAMEFGRATKSERSGEPSRSQ